MTKTEIIELTLQQIEYRQNPPPEEIVDCVGIEGYDDFVIATLNELLPTGDIKTCEDFSDLRVECCHTCHTYYPHFDMQLVDFPDRTKAWICCSLRSALCKSDSKMDESLLGEMGGRNSTDADTLAANMGAIEQW
jgi:hypothetical protein